jgi:hypothetical protein
MYVTVAALTFIQESDGDDDGEYFHLREQIWDDVTLGIQFLLQAQQTSTENNMRGAIPVKFPHRFDSDYEVRVDYVQHSMSAMIAYEKMLHKRLSVRPSSPSSSSISSRSSPSTTGRTNRDTAKDGMMISTREANYPSTSGIRMIYLGPILVGTIIFVTALFVIYRVYYTKLIRLRSRKRR